MAQNLIMLLGRLLGSDAVLSRIGALIGASPEQGQAAISSAVPALLASLVGVAQKPEGRNQLAALVQRQDTSLLDNVTGALSGGRETSLIDSGSSMLSSLFGQRQLDGLADAVGKSTGLKQSSAGSLLGALAPVVMGALGREQRAQGLDAQGLARMLSDQKDDIAHALPAGLANTLGLSGFLEGIADRLGEGASTVGRAGRATAAEAVRTASVAATSAAGIAGASRRRRGSLLRWVVGGVAALAVLWVAYHFLFRGDQVQEAADQAVDTTAQVGEAAKNLMVGDVDVGQEVTNLVEGTTTALNDVTDAASAEAALPKLNELGASLDKVSGVVKQLPAEGRSALAALVSAALPNLEGLIAKVNVIPGAADVIKPVADSMLEKLRAMTA